MDPSSVRFGTINGRKRRELRSPSDQRKNIFRSVSRKRPPFPVIPNPFYRDKHGQPFIPPSIFAKDSTSFPKLVDDDEDDKLNENIQTVLQSAVRRSIRSIKLTQIESRFDQLSLDSGLTRAELQLLRQTKYDPSVVEDFLLGKWRDEVRVKGFFRNSKPIVSSWINPDGKQGIIRGYTSFIELLDWRRRAEEDIGRMNFDEFMKDPDTEVDWDYVSTVMYNEAKTDKSASHWKNSYKYFLGPHVRLLSLWNQEEIKKLQSIIRQSKSLNFVKIASQMGPNYSPLICFQVYTKYLKHPKNPKPIPGSSKSAVSSTNGAINLEGSGANRNTNADKIPDSVNTYLRPWELSLFNDGMSEHKVHSEAKRIKERVTKSRMYTDVEDAILLTTITELNTEHAHILDLCCREEVLNYLSLEYDEILEWREDSSSQARVNTLFQGHVVRWTKREDRLLLALAHKHKHDWVKISKAFQKPFRNNRSLCRRLRTLKKNLQDGSLEEYHNHFYGDFHATGLRTRSSYGLLRRALFCLKSLVLAYTLGHNWVERYTRIYSVQRTNTQLYRQVKLYHSELMEIGRKRKEERKRMKMPQQEMKSNAETKERKMFSETEIRGRIAESKVSVKRRLRSQISDFAQNKDEAYSKGDPTGFIVDSTNSNLSMEHQEFPDQQELLVQQELSELQELLEHYELSNQQELSQQHPEQQELTEQEDFSEHDLNTELQHLSEQQYWRKSKFKLIGNSPPTTSDLIKYLWSMDIKAITRTLAFLTKFLALNSNKVINEEPPEWKNGVKIDVDHFIMKSRRSRRRRAGNGFDRTCPKSLATAVYLRRIELKSEDEMSEDENKALTTFERSTLAWFKWFSSKKCIKRTTKRKIPEMMELLQYPELQNLLRIDCSKIKWEPVEQFEPDPYVKVQVKLEDAGNIVSPVTHYYPSQNLHLRVNEESMQEETEEWSSNLNSSDPEAVIVSDSIENFVSSVVEHPDIYTPKISLKTAGNGKGKKTSRLKKVRREVSLMRWAARKRNANIEKNKEEFITNSLVPEQ